MMKHPTNNEIWFAEQRDLAIEERDEQRARAEALAAELRELRENVMLGLGMTAAAVAAVDDELADSTIGYLLTGHKEMAAALRHMTEERDAISSAWDELAAERDALRAQLDAEGWRPVDDLDITQDVEAEIMMRATYQHKYGTWDARAINILKHDADYWRPAPPQE